MNRPVIAHEAEPFHPWPSLPNLIQINTSAYRTALSSTSKCVRAQLDAPKVSSGVCEPSRLQTVPQTPKRASLGTVDSGESYLIRIDNHCHPRGLESAQRAEDRKNAAPRITASSFQG